MGVDRACPVSCQVGCGNFLALASTTASMAGSEGPGSGCNIHLTDANAGTTEKEASANESRPGVPPSTQTLATGLPKTWNCISSDDARVGPYGIASLQPYTGKWVLNWSRVIESTGSRRQQQWLYRWYSKKYKLVQLKARNASGYAIVDSTQADAGGPPAEFDKKAQGAGPVLLSFCLAHPPRAPCGDKLLGQKQEGSVARSTFHALELLRGIEFLD